ncbi:MAG: O-antigen ligase family protein, partial [Planctomycetota bacterium]|nr:O-antigen ligase family protein [Planctomycetota bacterium]
LGLLALVATQSRTGAIAAAAALALYFGWNWPRLRLPLLGSVVLVVLVVGVAFGERNTVKVRLHWYEAALKLGVEKPALGHGAGGFAREYPPIRPLEEHSIEDARRVQAVHNDYLQSWADGGALGLAAHLLLLIVAARAARRSRPAAASLLAFATASMVDLPLQDPSLLALAFLSLQMTARRRRTRVLTAPAFLSVYPALLAFSLFVVPAWSHWRADRQFASALEARQARGTEWRAALDRCLELEPGYADALEERGHAGDLESLLLQRPHDGWSHFHLAEMRDREDVAGFEQILEKHDPHHVASLVRIAELRMEDDPLAAVSYLRRALDANARDPLPYLVFARLRRLRGQYDVAITMLETAAARDQTRLATVVGYRSKQPAISLEKIDLTLELSRNKKIAGAERDRRLLLAVPHVPRHVVLHRIDVALDAAERIKQELETSRPRVQARPGESPIDYARRVQAAKAGWTRDLQARTRPEYAEAQVLTAVLLEVEPDAALFKRAAEAARGLGDLAGAARLEAHSLFVEGLDALQRRDERLASVRFRRALRADPFFGRVEGVPEALALFLRENPGVPRDSEALQVLARVEELRRVMAPAD